jgi:hypothetical protein
MYGRLVVEVEVLSVEWYSLWWSYLWGKQTAAVNSIRASGS